MLSQEVGEASQSQSKSKVKKDQLADSVSMMANTFSSYLTYKAEPQATLPKLKYIEMWSNFDRMVSKWDENEVDDLNIDIMNLIGAAIKKKRSNQ